MSSIISTTSGIFLKGLRTLFWLKRTYFSAACACFSVKNKKNSLAKLTTSVILQCVELEDKRNKNKTKCEGKQFNFCDSQVFTLISRRECLLNKGTYSSKCQNQTVWPSLALSLCLQGDHRVCKEGPQRPGLGIGPAVLASSPSWVLLNFICLIPGHWGTMRPPYTAGSDHATQDLSTLGYRTNKPWLGLQRKELPLVKDHLTDNPKRTKGVSQLWCSLSNTYISSPWSWKE